MKPTLLYLHDDHEIPTEHWPELGGLVAVDAVQQMKWRLDGYDQGNVLLPGRVVVSLPEGSESSLRLLEDDAPNAHVLAISVRRRSGLHVGWWNRLESLCRLEGIGVAEHTRHDVAEVLALRYYWDGLKLLEKSAEILRGEGIDPSNEAMRTEMALTRAIESLRASGFRAPKKR